MPDRSVYATLALLIVYLSFRDASYTPSLIANPQPPRPTPLAGVKFTVLDDAGNVAKVVSSQLTPHSLRVSYCGSCGYGKLYATQRAELSREFPSLTIDGSIHPTPFLQGFVAKAASLLSWATMLYSFAGEKLFVALKVAEPTLLTTLRGNIMYRIGLFFLLNQVSARLGNTGAYEVSLDGVLLFSKLATGNPPTTDALVTLIRNAVLADDSAAQ
jgi:selT/selW/selH-like putative selenoprotein